MAKLGISTGSQPNDGTGDSLIDGAVKVNSNFNEIYTTIGNGTTLAVPVTSVSSGAGISLSGSTGNVTISNIGIADTNNLRTDFLEVSGISTLSGGLTVAGSGNVSLDSGNLTLASGGIHAVGSSQNLNWGGGNLYFNSGSPEIGWTSGSGSVVVGAGSGATIPGQTFKIEGTNARNDMAVFTSGGSAELYYNNVKKFETSGVGVTITGDITCSNISATGNIDSANLDTGTGSLTLGNASSAFDISWSPATGTSPTIRWALSDGISIMGRYNGGSDLLEDVRFGTSGQPSYFKNLVPKSDSTYDLGTNTNRWAAVYSDEFHGGGANITGISTLNIVNYSGGGGGGGSDTLADVTSRGATTNQTISFSASKGISMDTASNNDFQIYGSSNQKAYITHAQNNGGGGAGDLVVIAKNGLHVYGGTSETTANLGLEVASGSSNLLYQGNSKLTTTNTGINVTGHTETDTLNVSGISTIGSTLYVGQSGNQYGIIVKGQGATGGGEINLTGLNSSDANATYYSNIRLNRIGSNFRYDLEFHSNGYSSGDIGDFVFYRRRTSNQRTERMRLSGETGNLTVTGGGSFVGIVTVGAGTSTGVTNTPALTLSHNNPTVVSTAGTTGQFKQIGGQPYYYDGTTWRALFLSEAPLTVNQADSDWDNTMIRMNFDQANIGAVTNLKDGRTPNVGLVDVVSSPVKYGTKSARLQSNNSGISFSQNNSGSIYYPFEGAWTLEGWFFFDGTQLPTTQSIPNSAILFSNFHPNTNTGSNWKIGYYHAGGGSTTYNFFWSNKNSSATGGGGAGNSTTGFLLQQLSSTTFANNAWHHIALVREPSNGSIHFYFDGTETSRTSTDQLVDNEIDDVSDHSFNIGYYGIVGDIGRFDGLVDDVRVSKSARYTANFTPPAAALPITGSTTTVYEPANSKVGEISLGGSPSWTGTPGITASQIAAGQYRATFATAYSNATDYVIQTSMNDYTPATTPVGIGVSRFATHADFFIRRVSDGANIDTGSLAIDLFKK